jgi:hypothetical protein
MRTSSPIISEASRHLSDELKARHPEIARVSLPRETLGEREGRALLAESLQKQEDRRRMGYLPNARHSPASL